MKEKNGKDYFECCIIKNCGGSGCDNYETRRDLIQKVIDGQASDEEKMLYDDVISKCNDCKCKQFCEQEMAIKNLLQTKLDRKTSASSVFQMQE